MLETASALLLLFGGLAIVIALLSLLLSAIDSLAPPRNASNADASSSPTQEQQRYRHPVAAAIQTYQETRESDERHRAERETITIRVLTATGGFALLAAIATGYSALIFTQQAADFRDQEQRQLRGYLGVTDMDFSCGDCLPTRDDLINVTSNNFGQTPIYIINGVLWFNEFLISEPFPEGDIRRKPSSYTDMIPRGLAAYPKIPKTTKYNMSADDSLMFWEAKNGTYWLMIRGYIRYQDIFDMKWDTFFCFIYNPTKFLKEGRFPECPKYHGEEKAKAYEFSQPPIGLQDVGNRKF
jgi:hypothetical protein